MLQVLGGRMAGVFDPYQDFLRPRMASEVTPDHSAVIAEFVEGISSIVNANKTSPRGNSFYQGASIFLRHRQLTSGRENNNIIVFSDGAPPDLEAVLKNIYVKELRFPPELSQGSLSKRKVIVYKPGRVG